MSGGETLMFDHDRNVFTSSLQKNGLGPISLLGGLHGLFVLVVGIFFTLMLFFGKPVETTSET